MANKHSALKVFFLFFKAHPGDDTPGVSHSRLRYRENDAHVPLLVEFLPLLCDVDECLANSRNSHNVGIPSQPAHR